MTTSLAPIAADTPEPGWRVLEREDLGMARMGKLRGEEYERKAGNSFK